jgi:hypothetical protein
LHQAPEALDQKTRADQQHECERDFGDDENLAGAIVTGRRIAFAFFQCFRQRRVCSLQSRRQAKQQARHQRYAKSKQQDISIGADLGHERQAFGKIRRQQSRARQRE